MRFRAIENKAIATARGLAAEYGDLLSIEPIPEYLTRDNVAAIIGEGDVVLLAVDNHATRHLVDEHCATLADVTVISGGNDGVEEGRSGTYGSVQIVRRVGGSHRSSALGRFHPEIRTPRDKPPGDLGCAELGSIPELIAWIAAAKHVLTVNTAASILSSAVRHSWHHIPDLDPRHDWVHPRRVVVARPI